jgi:hypothetical protein
MKLVPSIAAVALLSLRLAASVFGADEVDKAAIQELVPIASGTTLATLDKLATSATVPKLSSFKSQTLTLVLLVSNTDASDAKRREFGPLKGQPIKPSEIVGEMTRYVKGSGRLRFAFGPVTMIQADRIKKFTADIDRDMATGIIEFEVPKLYAGRVEYTARKHDGKWRIQEFRLPARGIHLKLEKDGTWKHVKVDPKKNTNANGALLVPKPIQVVINKRCIGCHSADNVEGDVRFDTLSALGKDAWLELLNKAQEQLFFGLMPPKDAEQPTESEHTLVSDWVRTELKKFGVSKLDEKMRHPDYGNYVNHEKLFSGEIKQKAYTSARRWLVSPQIFIQRVIDVFKIQGRDRERYKRGFYGVTNPIILPDRSGVRYYDNTTLDGGHLLMMLTNADWISYKQIRAARVKNGELKANEFSNPKDRWFPRETPEPFEAIILKESQPTDDELTDAIHTQFDCVLRRRASDQELQKYLELIRSAIALGGNTEGLRQMLVTVLLESEFLYRLEFGAGDTDKSGRKKLSPREASYAIAYAISDRGPDAGLVKAAREGMLNTKGDYKREVLRLLNDSTTFLAEGAPSVNSIHLKSHKVTHPKINRFFREFFGYPNSIKVFKDTARSGGFYGNPDRGYTGTAGGITNEADRVVDFILRQDRNVFEQLLTTEKFFVLHPYSNEKGAEIVAAWRKSYEQFKDSDWQDNPEKFITDNFEKHKQLFKNIKITDLKGRHNVRGFKRFMGYFDQTFGKGITPFIYPWFFHGGQTFRYSKIYSLPGAPGSGPIGASGIYRDSDNWDYPVVQPFKIANRKGILTHPAWLVAHSQNTATDPVRRGRWIREKLLAGHVPDVPITVDAQIPEDPHRTLRERLDSVTTKQECWKCHQHMNPLGLPFEAYDDFGRYRTEESFEHPDNLIKRGNGKSSADVFKTKSVNSKGHLSGTGDNQLDGEVNDAIDMIERLAKSDRVRQSFIRHAFRYFMGRNEILSDSQTLVDADRAYVESDGSFKAVVVSLLTSDSFIYRK